MTSDELLVEATLPLPVSHADQIAIQGLQTEFRVPEIGKIELPTVVGLSHTDENLGETLRLVHGLPAESNLGLEVSAPSDLREHPSLRDAFFNTVGSYAEELGHTVVWLEPDSTCDTPLFRKEIELRIEIAETPWYKRPAKYLKALIEIAENDTLRHLEMEMHRTAAPRSVAMLKTIIDEESWKPGDLAIIGFNHAMHLADIMRSPFRSLRFHTPAMSKIVAENLYIARSYLRNMWANRQRF